MNTLVILAALLFFLMVLIGGKKGVRSFISLFLNFVVLLFMIFLLNAPQINPILLTAIACIIISAINLFFVNQINSKTITAFLATLVTITIMLFLIYILTTKAMVQGFSEEETEAISVFSLHVGVDFVKIGAAVIIMSTIGAITDVAIAISSPMQEVFRHHPQICRKDLFSSGMRIGRDVLGTDTNTLYFAFIGGYLGLLLWFKDLSYSFGQIINSKVFAAEILTIFCAGIGIAMIIPISASINAHYLVSTREKSSNSK